MTIVNLSVAELVLMAYLIHEPPEFLVVHEQPQFNEQGSGTSSGMFVTIS